MDSVTHALFGLTIYGATNKEDMPKEVKKSVFVAAVAGSMIPDIDVISQLWDTEGMYQMWHRGITHSIFLVPVWALLIWLVCFLIWKTKDRRIFYIAALAVFIHNTSDILNAWGTGYFEPFSDARLGFGTIPIVDVVIWLIMLIGFLVVKIKKVTPHKVYKIVWVFIIAHILVQSIQGYIIYQSTVDQYEEQALTARFIPGHFKIAGKNGLEVEVLQGTVWGGLEVVDQITSQAETNLDVLFRENPRAKTLYQWSPFVVVVDDEEKLGIYDPRFFRMGVPFLYEYIYKEDVQIEE
ncbi:metal-dependent hydrolase [Alkalihalobacterium chitinilyticum]|uniref:Metal-dependent hydrolase n=1 Tax=Alkalihalobacterium chitinilyticum TaxID=2980103 RepID=A0ABT5VLC3_9BACI|nr:metal-dependent hydrolase [Alkalihalobacterium chitinilyticum]MDE5415049.1 metal-dependent hydrolase [Alkalihalobacterium chitinilyticum]